MNRNANKYFLPSLHLLINVSIVESFVFHCQFLLNKFKITQFRGKWGHFDNILDFLYIKFSRISVLVTIKVVDMWKNIQVKWISKWHLSCCKQLFKKYFF